MENLTEFKQYCVNNGIKNPIVYESATEFFASAPHSEGNVMNSDILSMFHHVRDYITVDKKSGYTLKFYKDMRDGNGSFGWNIGGRKLQNLHPAFYNK